MVEVSDKGFMEVARIVEDVYENIYGGDYVSTGYIQGRYRVKARRVDDKTFIEDEDGGVSIDLSSAQPNTETKINRNIQEGSRSREAEARDYFGSASDSSGISKPYGHSEAAYKSPEDPDFDQSHEKCSSCAWYDNDGGCRIVEDIEPNGYCENFYADVLAAAHKHPDKMEVNLVAWGENADFNTSDIEELADKIAERMR